MNIIEQIEQSFIDHIQRLFTLSPEQTANIRLSVNTDEAKSAFGDISSNAAMTLAQLLKQNPLQLGQQIAGSFAHSYVAQVALHKPGFINIYLTQEALQQLTQELYRADKDFFKLFAQPTQNINLEFVSANPTGPLHFGHGRGAIIGDVLAKVINFVGQKATREFYINNAGAQMQKLGMSFKIRCQQICGLDVSLPEEAYHGEYLKELANELIAHKGARVFEEYDDNYFAQYAETHLLDKIKKTLENYGVIFDVWFPETKLHQHGEIKKALTILHQNGYLYEKENATWFKATAFGDDKDRVLVKAGGEYTYAAADIAYMLDKIDRGFNHLIMILGHDHHSYLTRLQCIQKALNLTQYPLDIILYQLVKMKQSGQLVRMSKRAGNIVTLDDVIETVGKDVARFFFLHRKADAQLEFDLDLALKRTDENPVYYVQYAYVRTRSILAKAEQHTALAHINHEDAAQIEQSEAMLIKKIYALKSILQTIYQTHQTHLLANYAHELAQIFHSYYGANKVIDETDIKRSRSRLLLIKTLKNTFETVFDLLGISCPERM